MIGNDRRVLNRLFFTATALLAPLPAFSSGSVSCILPKIPLMSHVAVAQNAQTIYSLKNYHAALCNDGTPGAYIFRPGVGSGATRWVFHLHGGGQCTDDASCAVRNPDHLSSKTYVPGTSGPAMSGILSANSHVNPDFYDANAVEVEYCSSDFWAGDKAPATPGFDRNNAAQTWYFRGRAIATAALQDLFSKGLASAQEILFTGSSAGGVGIVLDANDLMPLAPPAARKLVAADAGYALDIGAYDSHSPATNYVSPVTPTPGELILSGGASLWGGRGDRYCDAAARTAQAHTDCYNSATIIDSGYIAQPVFVDEALEDRAQLRDDGLPGGTIGNTGPGPTYSRAFAVAMTCLLDGPLATNCADPGAGTKNAIYAPYAHIHTMLDQDAAFQKSHPFGPQNEKLSPQQEVGQWYSSPCTPQNLVGTVPEMTGLRDLLASIAGGS